MKYYELTAESVTEGHPDKTCDKISDAILDAYLKKDSEAKVAIETFITKNFLLVAGEIKSKFKINVKKIAKDTLKEIGYTDIKYGFDYKKCEILVKINKQSPDISQGVEKNNGAGDQGIMFGFACNETPELMPLPITIANKLSKKLTDVRKKNIIKNIGPDGKTQVTVKYFKGIPLKITKIVVAQQHTDSVNENQLKKEIFEKVIIPICGDLIDEKTKYIINGTGKFVIGGPLADTGLTGRKIIIDTYGGIGRHGGGAFSGKDPTKVDRSACYMCRHIAKNIVAKKLAKRCEIQISYCIGVSRPVSIFVNTFKTGKSSKKISKFIKENFNLEPKNIIQYLDLKKPIYYQTAAYGHFGRDEFSWEKII